MNILVIGAGFFSQNVHIKCLKKNKIIKKIFIYDERKKLAFDASKKFKISLLSTLNQKSLKEKKIKKVLLCFQREKSYHYSKFLLNLGIDLLCEKPAVLKKKNLVSLLKLAKRKKSVFQIGFQKTHDQKIIFFKKKINFFIKKFGKIHFANFELFNGDMRWGKKTIVRTNEIILNQSYDEKTDYISNKKKEIMYKIFINRYIHSINLFNFLFPTRFKDLIINLNYASKLNYSFTLSDRKRKTLYSFIFGDYQFNGWHDKLEIFFEKAIIKISLPSPLDNNSSSYLKVYDGIKKKSSVINFKEKLKWSFENQLENFLKNKNLKNKNFLFDNYFKDYKIIDSIFKKNLQFNYK